MTRFRGRAKRGKRLVDSAPCGHWESTTMMSSVNIKGETDCMVIEGATTKIVFERYVEEVLSQKLKPGDIVIMDNLPSHKSSTAQEIIEAKGATIKFLPPYSPDLNPIEEMWSKVKEFLRNAKARTTERLYEEIGKALDNVTGENAIGWYKDCGYALL